MKRGVKIFFYLIVLFLLFLIPVVVALECIEPTSDEITEDVLFCDGTYYLQNGLKLSKSAKDIEIDCYSTKIMGNGAGQGIVIEDMENITIKNCIFNYYHTAVLVMDSENIEILSNKIDNNTDGIKVLTSKNIKVNKNELTGNKNIAINLISCSDCEHSNNKMKDNSQSMIIEYLCIGGDNICPENCNGTLDYDCPAICGDEICTTDGDCDCDENDTPLDKVIIEDEEEIEENEIEDTTEDEDTTDEEIVVEDIEVKNEYQEDSLLITTLDFNFEDTTQEETKKEDLVDVIYPVTKDIENNVPTAVFEKVKTDNDKHDKIIEDIEFSKKMIVNQGKTIIQLTLKPKKDIPLLMLHEYFPDNVLKGATEISSNNEGVKFSKKKQMANVKLTRLKKNNEYVISFFIDKEVLDGESYSVFYKTYNNRNFLIVTLLLLIVLMYVYYALSIRPFLKKYEMYLHKHISDRYLLIAKDDILSMLIIFPIVAIIFLLFEVSLKLLIGIWLFKLIVIALFLVYLGFFMVLFIDLVDFKKRYHIGKKRKRK